MLAQAQFENENRMREIKQRKTQNRYLIIILTLGLVLVSIGLVYFIQRNKVQLLDLKKKNLELEKKYLNNELTNFAIHINQKNVFLTDLKSQIQNFRKLENEDQDAKISELNSLITQNLQQKDESEDFQIHADKLNREIVIKLNQKFPDLTPKEVQLCVLLKLNLSTKEIASIKHVTPRAVKVARYRLRKKLNLPLEGNISEYLNELLYCCIPSVYP
jgi:DNA-binding CsgD family transcriptional regulator